MADTLRMLSVIAFSIASAALVVGVILWFTLNIQNVIGYLTGRNVKKATENIGSLGGRTLYKRPNGNVGKNKKQADKAKPQKAQKRKKAEPVVESTMPLAVEPTTALAEGTALLDGSDGVEGTALLDGSDGVEGTALLDGSDGVEGTALLDDGEQAEGTTVLDAQSAKYSSFVITESIVMVHTDEDIKIKINY